MRTRVPSRSATGRSNRANLAAASLMTPSMYHVEPARGALIPRPPRRWGGGAPAPRRACDVTRRLCFAGPWHWGCSHLASTVTHQVDGGGGVRDAGEPAPEGRAAVHAD